MSWRQLAVTEVTAHQLLDWVDGYERAWRTAGTDGLRDLFTDDAEYLVSPYDAPVVGLAAISRLWDEERTGPDEVFTMTAEVVACQGPIGVARVQVRYGDPLVQEYLDLWVVRFAAGRLVRAVRRVGALAVAERRRLPDRCRWRRRPVAAP